MPSPTTTFYRVTGAGTTYLNDLSRFGVAGGPTGVQVGNVANAQDPLSFGDVDGGVWSVPIPMILQIDGGQLQSLKLRLYDYVSSLEDFFDGVGGDWDFRIDLRADYVNPNTITPTEILTWDPLPAGVSELGYDLDVNRPNPANDHTASLLVAHATVPARYLTNFYIYLAAKPEGNAVAGLHENWSFRLTAKDAGQA